MKPRARVSLYTEKNPFNFQDRDPHAIILPFYSKALPEKYKNWSLVAEKDGDIQVGGGRRFVMCRLSFLEPEANEYLKSGLFGYYVPDGKTAIASVEVL